MNDVLTRITRTVTPIIVGGIITYFAHKGLTFDNSFTANLEMVTQGIITAGYYIVVTLIEHKAPSFGWLLGSPKKPIYLEQDMQPGQ